LVEKLKVESEEKKKTLSSSNHHHSVSIMTTVAQDDFIKHRVSLDWCPVEIALLIINEWIWGWADIRGKNEQQRIQGYKWVFLLKLALYHHWNSNSPFIFYSITPRRRMSTLRAVSLASRKVFHLWHDSSLQNVNLRKKEFESPLMTDWGARSNQRYESWESAIDGIEDTRSSFMRWNWVSIRLEAEDRRLTTHCDVTSLEISTSAESWRQFRRASLKTKISVSQKKRFLHMKRFSLALHWEGRETLYPLYHFKLLSIVEHQTRGQLN